MSPPLSLTNRINHRVQVGAGKPIKWISQNIRLYLRVKPRLPGAVREICMPLSQMNGSTLYLQCDGFSIFPTDITRDSIRWREMIERCGAAGEEGAAVVNISWKNKGGGEINWAGQVEWKRGSCLLTTPANGKAIMEQRWAQDDLFPAPPNASLPRKCCLRFVLDNKGFFFFYIYIVFVFAGNNIKTPSV